MEGGGGRVDVDVVCGTSGTLGTLGARLTSSLFCTGYNKRISINQVVVKILVVTLKV